MNEKILCQMIAINVNNIIDATEVKDNHLDVGALDYDKAYKIDKIITECRKDLYQLVNIDIDYRFPHNLQSKYMENKK